MTFTISSTGNPAKPWCLQSEHGGGDYRYVHAALEQAEHEAENAGFEAVDWVHAALGNEHGAVYTGTAVGSRNR